MPVYAYKCESCHKEMDIQATIEEKIAVDPAVFFCPACGSTDIKQSFSLQAMIKKADEQSGDCDPGGGCCG